MEAFPDRVRIFGIRHHGPGSARSLAAALERLQPDALLVEGPPEADALLPLAASEAMRPPVALLIYSAKDPGCAAYYPFARYSPEWQAVLYGLRAGIPVRMMDLAQSIQMAMNQARAAPDDTARDEVNAAAEPQPPEKMGEVVEDTGEIPETAPMRGFDTGDPLRMLAEAAGYADGEQWWEHLVEQYRGTGPDSDPTLLFDAILEGMTALREAAPPETDALALRREAAMRQSIRAAKRDGFQRIAVVCGAWHAPALADPGEAAEDERLLRGLPKLEMRATWVPWTEARLTRASGYGAGIDAPGWYDHLWSTTSSIAAQWMIRAAGLLRAEGLDISPAHTIEAVRLAETLAALRDRPIPGLPELSEAALAVYCAGSPAPLRLIAEKLVIGEGLGNVPPETPAAPLQQDFDRETRRLRMQPAAVEKLLQLDLRKPLDLGRSHLLHRLGLLGISWGHSSAALQSAASGRSGTFHEVWKLRWMPEFSVMLIEAGQHGSTIATAAAAKARRSALSAPDLAALTGLIEDTLLAELPEAVHALTRRLQDLAAVSSDVRHMLQAIPPLAGVLRYGNVRQTDSAAIAAVVNGLVARACIGLPGACAGLQDDAAAELFEMILKVDEALARLDDPENRAAWQHALEQLARLPNIHGLIAGRASRILLDGGSLPADQAAQRFGLALSTAVEPLHAASWVEGFLRGSGQLLIHDEMLLGIVDAWLVALPEAAFPQVLPLLRRTFSTFAQPERRGIGECVRKNGGSARQAQPSAEDGEDFDAARAERVLPLLAKLLGK